jgi:hypothetical protein
MSTLLRHALLLAVSAWVSWWLFLRVPPEAAAVAHAPASALEVLPLVRDPAPRPLASPTQPAAVAAAAALVDAEAEPEPPPPERGTPEGRVDEEGLVAREEPVESPAPPEVDPEPSAPEPDADASDADHAPLAAPEPPAETVEDARQPAATDALARHMRDPALLAAARAEFERGNRKGFTTVLLSTPEDQLAIARFFGEELVLVPRAALDAAAATGYFRLVPGERGAPGESGRIERVAGAPQLENHRQYRDLFDYEYARLPDALRELRRSLVAREDVYLFAALLSVEEWALVIARRGAALADAGRELDDVRRFVLRYVPLVGGAYDLRVEEIVFTDGTRFVARAPDARSQEEG